MVKKPITYDYNNVMQGRVGGPATVTGEELESYGEKSKEIHDILTKRRKGGELPFYELPYRKEYLKSVKETGDALKQEMGGDLENLLVIGIGGSSLGGIALTSALCHPFHNVLVPDERKAPRVFFAENVDPDETSALLDMLDPEKTVINIISKSGTTAEPMANFLLFQKAMADRIGKDKFARRVVATTDPESGTLRKISEDMGFRTLEIPPGVGGRFTVLSPVGLFPGYLAGIDLESLLEGVAAMDKRCSVPDIQKNPAYMNGIIHYHLHVTRGVNQAVLMPYASSLARISDWYRQMLAESLGKKFGLDGRVVYAGQTPIKAVGVIDQHSQIQLYREGPFDKIITVLSVQNFGNFLNLPSLYPEHEGLAYLGGHTQNELLQAEKTATILALVKSQRPSIEITLPEINAHTIGQVFYLYEVQTVFAGYLYGINSLDQPGVEAGKQYTYGILGRKGYADRKKEVDSFPAKDDRHVM
jgi:glucose-6-phosphate isomerase